MQEFMVGDMAFEAVSRATKPLLLAKDSTLYVKMEGEIREAADIAQNEAQRGAGKGPMHVADVIDLTTGEEAILIINTVMESTFSKLAEKGGYVGKCYAIKPLGIKAGKKYTSVDIYEIRPKQSAPAPAPTAAPDESPAPTAPAAHKRK